MARVRMNWHDSSCVLMAPTSSVRSLPSAAPAGRASSAPSTPNTHLLVRNCDVVRIDASWYSRRFSSISACSRATAARSPRACAALSSLLSRWKDDVTLRALRAERVGAEMPASGTFRDRFRDMGMHRS